MISIGHNSFLNAASAGLAAGIDRGIDVGQRQQALDETRRRTDLADAESKASLKLAQEREARMAAGDAQAMQIQADNAEYAKKIRAQGDAEGRAWDLVEQLRAAGQEHNAINAPIDSPLSEDYVGPGSKQMELMAKLDEELRNVGAENRRELLAEKHNQLAFTVLAADARKQVGRIGMMSGAGTPISGQPLGLITPEQGQALISGMQTFVATEGKAGLNPVQVGQHLTEIETEHATKASYQAEGQRMLGSLVAQHTLTAQGFPNVRMPRAGAALSLIGMRAPQTQEELDGMQQAYMKALSEDFAAASRLDEQRIRTTGNRGGSDRTGGWTQKDLRAAALSELEPEYTTHDAVNGDTKRPIPAEAIRAKMREILQGTDEQMTPDILPPGSASEPAQTTEPTGDAITPEDEQWAMSAYEKARETMTPEQARKHVEMLRAMQSNGQQGDPIEASGAVLRRARGQTRAPEKKKDPEKKERGQVDWERDPAVRAALATKKRPRE